MIKKIIFALLIPIIIIAGYFVGSPEIQVINQSAEAIKEVAIQLPSNNVVFGVVPANSESTIYYSWSQNDGIYKYELKLINGKKIDGKCGYVTQYQIGKKLIILVDSDFRVTCKESFKV